MNRVYISTNSRNVIMRKMFAWALSFFIVISSFAVGRTEMKVSLVDTAKVSADALVSQFFYISTLPLNVISKLFVESENSVATPLAPSKDSKKSSQQSNAVQASVGYSIMPTTNLTQFVKAKNFNFQTFQSKVKKANFVATFRDIFCPVGLFNVGAFLKFNIMVLLLAILLTRRNIGDDNIILNIKNNTFARLV